MSATPYQVRPPPTVADIPPPQTYKHFRPMTIPKNDRKLFDSLLVMKGVRQSEIMKMEQWPKWMFWLIGTTKRKYIAGLRFDLNAIERRIDELRLVILSPNGTQNRETRAN